MRRQYQIVVPSGKTRERLDLFLTKAIENATRKKVQDAIKSGQVLVNNKLSKASYKILPLDVINVTLQKTQSQEIIPENIPLNIVYEDKYLIVIDKPAGMVTHPAFGNYSGTLVNALLFHCRGQLAGMDNIVRAGIVHRLDKDTSGLLVIAKDDITHAKLAKQFFQRTVDREYWAIVWGNFKKIKSGIVEANLGRSKSNRKKITVIENGKNAITEYEVIKNFDYVSLIKLKLRTGRTHQIRVHLHHIGHPVFGDPIYGGRKIVYGSGSRRNKEQIQILLDIMKRQALHARTLGFIHPKTNKKLKFHSKLPEDMKEVLSILKDIESDSFESLQ